MGGVHAGEQGLIIDSLPNHTHTLFSFYSSPTFLCISSSSSSFSSTPSGCWTA